MVKIIKVFWKVFLRQNVLSKEEEDEYYAEVSIAGETAKNEDIALAIVADSSEIKYDTLLSILNQSDRIKRDFLTEGRGVQSGVLLKAPRTIVYEHIHTVKKRRCNVSGNDRSVPCISASLIRSKMRSGHGQSIDGDMYRASMWTCTGLRRGHVQGVDAIMYASTLIRNGYTTVSGTGTGVFPVRGQSCVIPNSNERKGLRSGHKTFIYRHAIFERFA
jgi:hypothetical protein